MSYQSVDEVISLEFESLHRVKDVHLSVSTHLLSNDATRTEQSALTGAVHTVHHDRRRARGALCRTSLNHVHQLHEAVT